MLVPYGIAKEFFRMSLISFIVPAHNEERLLGETLRAIGEAARALPDPFEVIVVDDASVDKTAAIAGAHGARVVSVAFRQIARTRNAGARNAHGGWFVFVDADTLVNKEVLSAAIAALRAGAVGGGCSIRFDGRVPRYARALMAIAFPLYRALGLAAGCFLYCTREAFQAAGGFDESLFAAEEAALSFALHRQGRFVVLRESVTTSARKLRTFTAREILSMFLRVAIRPSALRRREGLDIWYGRRRPDP
jgi:glycosyltransferase involved in cell wall biosynthesis